MSKLCVAALALVVALSVPALAKKDKGPGKDKSQAAKIARHEHADRDDDERGWEKRDGYELRTFGRNDGYPSGWNKGRKTGWRDCGLPPGQAKKYGCYSYVHRGRRYYYYHDDGGRLIVRRPVIHISGDVIVR